MTVNFVDRLVLANVAPKLQSDLGLSAIQYSYIVFAFMTGMTIGQLPAGMFVDWLGARLALPIILSGWSIVNMLHSLARGVASFSGLRFAMGLLECGNYSSSVKVVGRLFPARERALALAVMDSGSLLGSIIAPPLVVFIVLHLGWRAAFFLPSLLGLAWLPLWFAVYRGNAVAKGTRVGSREPAGQALDHITVRTLLRNRKTWGIILMRGFGGPISQFYWYWLPLYLVRGRGMSLAMMAGLSSFSYLVGGTGNLLGGFGSRLLIQRGFSVDAARKIVFTSGGLCTLAAILVPAVSGIYTAVGLIALAIFGLNFTSSTLIAIITDVFPAATHARVTGLSGVGEGVMNMVLTLLTGAIVDRFSFTPVFAGAGLLPLGSITALFLLVGKIERVRLTS